MKTKLFFVVVLVMSMTVLSSAQVKVDAKKKVENQANQRANQKTDEAIDKAFNKLEEGIGSIFKKKNKKGKKNKDQQGRTINEQLGNDESEENIEDAKPAQPTVAWSRFDFVPGDEVIFEDAPSADEENGEFPSRWDLHQGGAEIVEMNGEKVILFLDGGSIVPYLKNSSDDYLPEIFTIEFDLYFKPGEAGRYWLRFNDEKNQDNTNNPVEIYMNGAEIGDSKNYYPGCNTGAWRRNETGGWRHMSVAYTKGKMKVYMDDTRLINIPHFEENPTGITIDVEDYHDNKPFMKNVRIAKGGVKYYDRVLSDGKIIVNGIRFDVNKATIKPESNGAINKIFELMKKQPDLNFSVEGHTDADGDAEKNKELSMARGHAVMNRLVEMGINSERLIWDGWGEERPIDTNDTPEGKANNRRVEFVKY